MEELCVALDEQFRARDIPLHADPAKSPFRIYRDVRFSKDKSPYKTHVAASFGWAGDGVDADGRPIPHRERPRAAAATSTSSRARSTSAAASGIPRRRGSTAFRQRLVDDLDGFRAIVEAPTFRKTFGTVGDDGESLKRVPPGYPADHPAADLLRLKNVTFGRRLSDDDAMSPRPAGRHRRQRSRSGRR